MVAVQPSHRWWARETAFEDEPTEIHPPAWGFTAGQDIAAWGHAWAGTQ